MANPQIADGYTKIANEIMDALCRYRIPGEERQVLDTILRKTYGWNKTEDAISLSQFVEMTGIKKPNIIGAINSLLSKKIIIVIQIDNTPAKVYRFNKNFDEWIPLSKKITLSKKIIGVIQKDNPSLSKRIPTKDTTTKDTTTKDIYRSNDFDRLWITYPKKVGKQAAIRAYRSHIKQIPPIEQLLAIVDRQKQTDQWKRGYIPNPATWINQGRWDDDITSMDGGQNGSTGTRKIYNRQGQGISTRQREIDAEAERLSNEYYALQAKGNSADG
jgi:phage replication O-like protein O